MRYGSKDFNEVMELAVRMYPTDETANLNAAIIRLNNGDADAAKPYLDRAGDSKEADAARKAYEMMMMQQNEKEIISKIKTIEL